MTSLRRCGLLFAVTLAAMAAAAIPAFAKGGPWAFTPPDQGLRASGWWPVSNDVVQTLETAGVHGPTAARTTTTALPSTSWSWIWALGIAAASVALIGLVDVLVTRSKRRATIV